MTRNTKEKENPHRRKYSCFAIGQGAKKKGSSRYFMKRSKGSSRYVMKHSPPIVNIAVPSHYRRTSRPSIRCAVAASLVNPSLFSTFLIFHNPLLFFWGAGVDCHDAALRHYYLFLASYLCFHFPVVLILRSALPFPVAVARLVFHSLLYLRQLFLPTGSRPGPFMLQRSFTLRA